MHFLRALLLVLELIINVTKAMLFFIFFIFLKKIMPNVALETIKAKWHTILQLLLHQSQ